MRIPGSLLSPEITRRADVPPMPPNWLRAFRPAWRALTGWPAQTPGGHGPTESSDHRQLQPDAGVRGMTAAAGSSGGAALGGGASVAPPPAFPPPAPPDSREHSERPIDPGQCARLHALSATLPTPDREIILLWAVAGVPTPDIAATLGITPTAVRHAQHQALNALPPAATTNGPPPATRQRVVLLPHARKPPDNRRTARATGMNHDDSPRPPPAHAARCARAADPEAEVSVLPTTVDHDVFAGESGSGSDVFPGRKTGQSGQRLGHRACTGHREQSVTAAS